MYLAYVASSNWLTEKSYTAMALANVDDTANL